MKVGLATSTTLICLLLLFVYQQPALGQDYPYHEKWEKIEQQEIDGLLKSTQPLVDEIYEQAKKDQDPQQKIRALLYQFKIILITEDQVEQEATIVKRFKSEIQQADAIEKNILQSLLAGSLYEYFQMNRHRIVNRTNLEEGQQNDEFLSWTEDAFKEEISRLYDASLDESEQLFKAAADNWSFLLDTMSQNRDLRPSVYDILAHSAMNFYGENGQEKKANALSQSLIDYYSGSNKNAFLYNIHTAFNRKNKADSVRIDTLSSMATLYPEAWYASEILLDLARAYQRRSYTSEATAEKKQNLDSVLAIARRMKEFYPATRAATELQERVVQHILSPAITVQSEKYVLPDHPIPIFVSHKNVDKLYIKVLKYQDPARNYFQHEYERLRDVRTQADIDSLLEENPTVQVYSRDLKHFDDYQSHSTIVPFDPLGNGEYVVLVSNDDSFTIDSLHSVAVHDLRVTDNALVTRESEILLTDRHSGKPLKNQPVDVYSHENDQPTLEFVQTVETDENGIAKVTNPESNYRGSITRIYQVKADQVYFRSQLPNPLARESRRKRDNVQFFIDRGIYRPGQTLYFKGIIYEETDEGHRVIKDDKITVSLHNANGENISSLELTSNEYGSVFGSFVIPHGELTGNFQLRVPSQYRSFKSFKVEEYKRPTFEVIIDTLKESLKIGDEVTVNGSIQAFSGAGVGNADIEYNIVRTTRFPYFHWQRSSYLHSQAETIAVGTTKADERGHFEISFTAEPAPEENVRFRFYNYEIQVTGKDINGETQESKQVLSLGDKSTVLSIPVDELNIDHTDSIPIHTTNLNGYPVHAKGNLRLIKLEAPKRILRASAYSAIDYQLEDSIAFIEYFPHLAFKNEADVKNWKKGEVALSEDFNTAVQKSVIIGSSNKLQAGAYLLEAYVLDGGDTLRFSRTIHIYRSEPTKPVDNKLLEVRLAQPSYEPGENVELILSSADKNTTVLVEFEQDGEIVKSERVTLNNSVRKLILPIAENDTKPVWIHYYMAKYNSFETGTIHVPIIDTANDLSIKIATFRDKLQPGDEEVWELTIRGAHKDEMMPELLALMYDASLDKFATNNLSFRNLNRQQPARLHWRLGPSFGLTYGRYLSDQSSISRLLPLKLESLEHFGFGLSQPTRHQARYRSKLSGEGVSVVLSAPPGGVMEAVVVGYGQQKRSTLTGNVAGVVTEESAELDALAAEEIELLKQVPVRDDLKETAFFYPDLRTDEDGNIKIRFTVPERLTAWKFMALAHTPTLRTAYLEKTVRTSKDLMVVPNAPRFLRVGDNITLSTKIVNLSESDLSGTAQLMLFDAKTMEPIDSLFSMPVATRKFSVDKGQSADVSWQLHVPSIPGLVSYRIVAAAGDFSDGEASVLPVLPNKQLVTETLSLYAKEGQNKQFTLPGLSKTQNPEHIGLSLEIATNPIWYAIQALPSLQDAPYPSSEQLFAQLYSSRVSSYLADAFPRLATALNEWRKPGMGQSKLNINEELKSIVIAETPWVRDAESEQQRMARLAVLFDENNQKQQQASLLRRLAGTQLASGAFSWFEGGPANRAITSQMLAGFGHLKHLNPTDLMFRDVDEAIIKKMIAYLDLNIREEMESKALSKAPVNNTLRYLYARSFFIEEYPLDSMLLSSILKDGEKAAAGEDLQSKAMLALIYHRTGEKEKAQAIIRSLKDYAVQSDEQGMYWKDNSSGWDWWKNPIETQTRLIEAFYEVSDDEESVEKMKVWLLKNKQTNHWASTKATTEAIYSLLLTGKNWVDSDLGVDVKIGDDVLDLVSETSAMGYYKRTWQPSEITSEMAQVQIDNTSPGIVWGGMYWQHLQKMDEIEASSAGLQVEKELFMKKFTEEGTVLHPITKETPLRVGDLVTVRLVIRSDRDLQFLHLKDARASGFEPVTVLSGYKWQGGLGYYESTRDAASNFFIDKLPKGTYVFEYDLRANNAGLFANGIATLQSMYAPEMSAHTAGMQVEILPIKE